MNSASRNRERRKALEERRGLRFCKTTVDAGPSAAVLREHAMRLGTTSFIYPAGWLENVERLSPRVRDVELLCFEADSLPDAREITGLCQQKRTHDLSYTVHTPLAASLASHSALRRSTGVDQVLRVVDALSPVEPFAYIVHVYLGEHEHDAPPRDLEAFRARAFESLRALIAHGVPPERVCVESLDYELAEIAPVVDALGLSFALDVGHWHRDRRDLRAGLDRYLQATRVIQWHGTAKDDRDHRSLSHYPEADALTLLNTLAAARYAGVLTLEVFREADFEDSLRLAADWLTRTGYPWVS